MARKAGKVSIFTVASELGISPATVSRVLNNRTGVGEATRRAVLELVRKYDFKLNYPQQHKPVVSIVINHLMGVSNYAAKVLTGIYSYLGTQDIIGSVVTADPREEHSILLRAREQQSSGIIIIVPQPFQHQLPELSGCGLPVMLVDERTEIENIGYIDNDAYSGSVELMQYLLDCGHRKIGFLLHWPEDINHRLRLRGYKDSLLNIGIEAPESWVMSYDPSAHGIGWRSGELMFEELITRHPDLTAVIAVNDELAVTAMHRAAQMKIRIPEDISIAGFDDNDYSKFLTPELTTVFHPCAEAGELAGKAIADYLASNGKNVLPKVVLPTRLIVRNSTGNAKEISVGQK